VSNVRENGDRLPMKLTLQHVHLKSTCELDSVIEERMLALGSQVQIDEAVVRLEHCRELSPAYRVRVHIITPGPDLIAEHQGFTLPAAFDGVLAQLESKIHGRALKRTQRLKSKLQAPAKARHGHGRRVGRL
jgi:ribosome-associated translation inhibitor RaiA